MNAALSARLSVVTMATLERLAFLFASPADEAPEAEEAELETVRVDFTGAFTGGLELSMSARVVAELAANMLGAGEGAALSADEQRDALKELANVVCGNLLPAIAHQADGFNIRARDPADADVPRWERPLAVSHLILENGICRVRMHVDGRPPRDPAGLTVAPSEGIERG
ncbi:MAG: chemotaxis protein CheX [Hyphomicrobiales bacterium]